MSQAMKQVPDVLKFLFEQQFNPNTKDNLDMRRQKYKGCVTALSGNHGILGRKSMINRILSNIQCL